jgi:hypothetical protein
VGVCEDGVRAASCFTGWGELSALLAAGGEKTREERRRRAAPNDTVWERGTQTGKEAGLMYWTYRARLVILHARHCGANGLLRSCLVVIQMGGGKRDEGEDMQSKKERKVTRTGWRAVVQGVESI